MIDKDKKILIISHNPLSKVKNNGKTLASIFSGIDHENIFQIYLNADVPDYGERCHFLRINEKQIIKSVIKGRNASCEEVLFESENIPVATKHIGSFGINIKRLARECIWKTALWKPKLSEWLSDKRFDVVFFTAGDGLFAYEVYRFVMENVSAKGCIFFTDDYILGKSSYPPVAMLRKVLLKDKIRKTLPIVNEVYVISDEMKEAYDKLWGVDSFIIRNFTNERKISFNKENRNTEANKNLVMVYAGGMHYNRWKVLEQIAISLSMINQASPLKCTLKIYCHQSVSQKIQKKIRINGVSEFCGAASAKQISEIYSHADILLHVESFDKKSIASTKYSFSTKIPEYLSADKCVLAVGPREVASIRYLAGFACTISDSSSLLSKLKQLIENSDYRDSIKSSCFRQYENDFSKKRQEDCLRQIVS